MKKSIKVLFLFFFFVLNLGYSQTWQWAKQIGGSQNDNGGMLCDNNGNIFCEGMFMSPCFFQTDTLYSNGYNDMFLAKYDNNGNEIWVKKFGGYNSSSSSESLNGIVIDETNNCLYVSGSFYGSMIIDNDTISSVSVDPFLAKFDYNGNCLWIKKITCLSTNDRSSSITIDQNGNVYWNAELSGPGNLDTFNLQKGGVLSKVSPNGTVLWAKNEFKDIHISWMGSHDNKLFFSGNTKNDTCLVETDTLISNSSIDVFLCCTDLNGSLLWAKRFGGIGNDYGGFLDFDDNGNMYICGAFSDTLILKDTISTSAFRDGFIAKLDLSGNLIWLKQSHSSNNGNVWVTGLVCDGDGNTYFIGILYSGSSTFGQFTISTTNFEDMFLTRYDPNGNCLGIRQFGYAEGFSVQMDALGKVYCSGLFYNTVTIGNTSLTSHGDADIFIAKSDAITGLGGQNRVVQNQLVIYANPNKGTFNIKVPDEIKSFKQAWLYVYNVAGKEIARFNLDNESDTPHFDISNSKPGSYSVKLVQGEYVYSGKMVVE